MQKLQNLADYRQTGFCVYCGAETETRDHVPSKIFLDEPYPADIPTVPACRACNQSFSLDEEYCACLIECIVAGTVDHFEIARDKIRRILEVKPSVASRIARARQEEGGFISFIPEIERVKNIAVKLARGHAAFELNEPQLADPTEISLVPLMLLDEETRLCFESLADCSESSGWPEVGSRAMQRLLVCEEAVYSPWVTVQKDRYRYLAVARGEVVIRGVLRGYLAFEVRWSED